MGTQVAGLAGVAPTVWAVPDTPQWGTKSEVAQKWAEGLHKPWRKGRPQHFKARRKIRSSPQVCYPSRQRVTEFTKWPTRSRVGNIAPGVWEVHEAPKTWENQ